MHFCYYIHLYYLICYIIFFIILRVILCYLDVNFWWLHQNYTFIQILKVFNPETGFSSINSVTHNATRSSSYAFDQWLRARESRDRRRSRFELLCRRVFPVAVWMRSKKGKRSFENFQELEVRTFLLQANRVRCESPEPLKWTELRVQILSLKVMSVTVWSGRRASGLAG